MKFINYIRKQLEDLLAMQQLSYTKLEYIPWTKSSIRPSGLIKILNEIILNNRNKIIEFGSGISTLYIGEILKINKNENIKFYSIENDKIWFNKMKELIRINDLENQINLILAPLNSSKYALDKDLLWYDENIIKNSLSSSDKFDLVLIDGPAAYRKEVALSRYPALPFLIENEFLNTSNCTIILDDIERQGERKIIKLWEKTYNVKFNLYPIEGGIGICFFNKNLSYSNIV